MIYKFDCVEMQRKIRNKFVEEAEMNFDNLIKLLDDKISKSEVYRKLKERLEEKEQLITVKIKIYL